MASFNHQENDEFAKRANQNNPGAWKRISRSETDILLRLPPGTYLLQRAKLIRTEIRYPGILRQELYVEYFYGGDRAVTIKHLESITEFVGKINAKIEQLIGMPNGGNDPGLKELYMTLGRLITEYYNSYTKVPSDHVWENNGECMGIVIERPEPGLLYNNGDDNGVVSRVGRKLAISPAPNELSNCPIAPNQVPESSVKVHRLESFVPKRQMGAHRNRCNSAKKQKGIRIRECSVKLERLETFIPKEQMKAYWKRYGDSVGQPKKKVGVNRTARGRFTRSKTGLIPRNAGGRFERKKKE